MPKFIDYEVDKAEDVYKAILPAWQDIISAESARAGRAIDDYMGYVDPALWPINEHHIPTMKLFRQVSLKVARDYMALIDKEPFFPIEAFDDSEQGIADSINFVMQRLLEQAGYKRHMDMMLRLMSNNGIAYIFPFWKIKLVKYPISLDFENVDPENMKKVAIDSFTEQGLGLKVIPSYMGCFDPKCGYDHASANWAMFRENISLNQLETLVKFGRIKMKLDDITGMKPDDPGYHAARQFNRTEEEQESAQIDHVLMPNRYIMVLNRKDVIKDLHYNPWTPGRINLIPFKNEVPPDPTICGGLSDNHIVGRTNFGYELAENTKFNQMRQALNMVWFYDPSQVVNENDLSAGHGNKRIAVRDVQKAVNIMQPPQTSPDLQRLPQEMDKLTDDIIGIQSYEQGSPPSPMPQATVFQGMQTGPASRLSHRYSRLEEPLAELCLHCATIAGTYATPEYLFKTFGARAIDLVQDIMDPNGDFKLDPRKLNGGYTLGFEASQKSNEHERQLAAVEKWFNLMANDPMLPPIAKMAAIETYTNMALISLPKKMRNKIIEPMKQYAMMMQMQMQSPAQPQLAPPASPNSPTRGAAQPRLGQRSAMPGMKMGEVT